MLNIKGLLQSKPSPMRFSTSIAYGPAFVIAILIFIDGIQYIVTRLSEVRNGVPELFSKRRMAW